MYTFVFISIRDDELSENFLRTCANITKKWMPAFGLELSEGYRILPECHSGWFWLAPPWADKFSLISECIDERFGVLVFGDIFGYAPHKAAQIVFDAWVSGGAQKVRNLEGCFSAVIVNRRDGEVVLIGDAMGRRALSYYAEGGTLIVSPHDVAMMTTGRIPLEFDEISVCSVAAVSWSLRGKSLLKQIQACHPAKYIRWSDRQLQHVTDSVIDTEQRIIQGDSKAIFRNLDRMIELAQAQARTFVGNQSEITCDLSAGIDSRVTWALLLSVIDDSSRIVAVSGGEPNSLDVRVARRLANIYRTGFLLYPRSSPSLDTFVDHCDLLAFHMNGGTEGARAMTSPPKLTRNPKVYACGVDGELFRGHYYPHSPFESEHSLSPMDALQILKKKNTRIRWLPWKVPELAEALLARFQALINEYATFSENGYDILDMYGLYEQSAVWGSAQARQTWKDPRWSPYVSTQLVKMAYMMPAPIGNYTTIHREVLRLLAPKTYWIRINDRRLLPLERVGHFSRFLREIDSKYLHNRNRIRRAWNRVRPLSKNKSTHQLAFDALAGPLMGTVREIVMSQNSFGLRIFSRNGVERLMHEQSIRTKDHTRLLGFLVSMERWRLMVEGVARDAGVK